MIEKTNRNVLLVHLRLDGVKAIEKCVAANTFIIDKIFLCLTNKGLQSLFSVVFMFFSFEAKFADELLEEKKLLDSLKAKEVSFLHLEKYVSNFVKLLLFLQIFLTRELVHQFLFQQLKLPSEFV